MEHFKRKNKVAILCFQSGAPPADKKSLFQLVVESATERPKGRNPICPELAGVDWFALLSTAGQCGAF